MTAAGWAATVVVVAVLFGFDLFRSARRPHAVEFREAVLWSVFYVAVAIAFGVVFALGAGWSLGEQYFAGYIVERSLSVDNLFVFIIIMGTFAVPIEQQPRALTIGIIAALALRTIFIVAGAALLSAFSFMFIVFGGALIVTAIQLFRHRDEDPDVEDNVFVTAARRLLPMSREYDGARLITRAAGRRALTPMFLVMIAIGSADVLFALDSIPAVFGITQHAYIVFAANAFALLGMRSLFFVVSGLLDRLVYLSSAVAVVLAFIGVKLVVHFVHLHHHATPEISTGLALAVIVAVLALASVASAVKVRANPGLRAHSGSLRERRRAQAADADDDQRAP